MLIMRTGAYPADCNITDAQCEVYSVNSFEQITRLSSEEFRWLNFSKSFPFLSKLFRLNHTKICSKMSS